LWGTTTIGRDNENDIVLDSIAVSRCHALLLYDGAEILLVDLESINGTQVNGALVRLDEPLRLAQGDVLRFGRVVARYSAALVIEIPLPCQYQEYSSI
jgi:pSer/pThr/pTyr-binding forkhead associated (FHA) protein